MTTLIYDGNFEGLLTAIFEVFEYRYSEVDIVSENNYHVEGLFSEPHKVLTQKDKADRVLQKLETNLGKDGLRQLLWVYLSEDERLEHLILSAVRLMLQFPAQNILYHLTNEEMLAIAKIVKSVGREIHRMNAFVRFEKLEDEVFFAKIEPDFNVLPMIRNHFYHRYRDQQWMIFDLKRNYGLYYNLSECQFIYPSETFSLNPNAMPFHEEELKYQKLWQRYFTKVDIVERKNMKLHIQQLPKRYWKYLTEKF
ncbi:TIGR03915 family putative DNA repair protein [Riemerella columbina]|uniref:TIGR03915 family putative DNA repair protein n=1 Tax=Riemerella columbina TaxID=103810 RepID=UPI00037F6C7C|nr:TIGR03915 family putative DNA repair protein [Riemerella columbina]